MRLLFVIPHPVEGPSSRFRVYQYLPYLEEMGVSCTVRPFVSSRRVKDLYRQGHTGRKIAVTLGGLAGRIGDLGRAARHDAVFILREAFALGPPVIETALARLGGKVLFDFDDAIYMPSLAFDNAIDRLRDWSKPAKIIARADTVIAGSAYLADYARRQGARRVRILPTVVDHTVYAPRPAGAADGSVTLGWIGTPRGSGYVAGLMPVFKRLHARAPGVKFVFIGCTPFDPQGLPIEFREWDLAREPQDIAGFDIGIMPLTDDEETRGKCGFKLIQYMSCGVAAIGSPVGVNNEIIEDGVSGLLAGSSAEWEEGLSRLVLDGGYRRSIAERGRQRAVGRYSLQATAPRMLEILRETVARP